MRCVQTYEEKCDYNQYDQSKHNCVKHPIFAIKNVTETECQICRHIWETEMVDALKWLVHNIERKCVPKIFLVQDM